MLLHSSHSCCPQRGVPVVEKPRALHNGSTMPGASQIGAQSPANAGCCGRSPTHGSSRISLDTEEVCRRCIGNENPSPAVSEVPPMVMVDSALTKSGLSDNIAPLKVDTVLSFLKLFRLAFRVGMSSKRLVSSSSPSRLLASASIDMESTAPEKNVRCELRFAKTGDTVWLFVPFLQPGSLMTDPGCIGEITVAPVAVESMLKR
mmetsp:Transcript_88935/g.176931  ORF Transcript_88935/g.176931 Transcript_88935/m.176931 type:complete len:204 (+) Transcript_88935:1226-1837(+)